ncbi:MAG TPA: DUF5666 domain-containing protein [Caldimonas sp.]
MDGVHYDDKKVVAGIDAPPTAPDAPASGASVEIKLGQHVEVTFTGDESNSAATSISVSAELVGKVSAIAPNLVVAGQTVTVNSDAAAGPITVFDGYTSAADIAVGDRVEVHGTPSAAGVVQATRIERRPSAEAWLRISGNVAALAADGSSFQLGGVTIKVDAGTKVFPAGAALANGQRVAVWSDTAALANVVTAKLVRIRKTSAGAATDARLAGAVTDCTAPCDASFKVAAIAINAASAEFVNGSKADLANGKWVELRGTLDLTSGAISASRVTFRKVEAGKVDVSLKGAITDFVDLAHFKVRGVPVTTDANTVTNASCSAPLAQGSLVSISGAVTGFTVLAKTIDCLASADGVSIEGKGVVLTVDPVAQTFTLGGSLFSKVTLSYDATTEFAAGTSASDLKVGVQVEVKGSVAGGVVSVTRIGLAEVLSSSPGAGVAVLETEGVASKVTLTGGVVSSFEIDGLVFTITGESTLRTLDGAFVDGARIHVLFKKVGPTNVVLLVNTKH